jgi:hypothetical protein
MKGEQLISIWRKSKSGIVFLVWIALVDLAMVASIIGGVSAIRFVYDGI